MVGSAGGEPGEVGRDDELQGRPGDWWRVGGRVGARTRGVGRAGKKGTFDVAASCAGESRP